MTFCATLLMLCMPPPALAQLIVPPSDDGRPLSRLAPLDPQSPWHARFAAAARELQPKLAEPDGDGWLPYFGGQWLNAADRARISATLKDETGGLRRTFAGPSASEFIILGWQPPGGATDYAKLADRPEADAIICWRNMGSVQPWPTTADEAEDRRTHGCVRMTYSVRFDLPQWRAFMDAPLPAGD
jgi:hypothetical protein